MAPKPLTDGELEIVREIEADCQPQPGDPEIEEEPEDEAEHWYRLAPIDDAESF